jgi:DNA-binding NarL/FixJ family response regulator
MNYIRILIGDGQRLAREACASFLQDEKRFEVIGNSGDSQEIIACAAEQNPDIILLDINLFPNTGLETLKIIHTSNPGSRIIGLSGNAQPAYVKKFLLSGASGYVGKNSSGIELKEAIIVVYNGHNYICKETRHLLTRGLLEEDSQLPDPEALTKRELEIIKLVRDGGSSKNIANQLQISIKTVELHRYRVLKKLKLKNAAALVNFINSSPAYML